MPVCGAKCRSRSGRLLRRKADTAADFTVLLDKHLHCGLAKTAHRAWDSQRWQLDVMILVLERCTPPFVVMHEAFAISATRTCHSFGGTGISASPKLDSESSLASYEWWISRRCWHQCAASVVISPLSKRKPGLARMIEA